MRFPTLPDCIAVIAACLAAERDRWSLFLPVLFGLGIALYFGLAEEPPSYWGAMAGLFSLAAGGVAWRAGRPALVVAAIVGAVTAAGFTAAQVETWRVAGPVLAHPVGPVVLEGQVLDVDPEGDRLRLLIEPHRMGRIRTMPDRIRLTLRRPDPAIEVGAEISVRALLMPPPGPAEPSGFDFQRQAWFQRIGAVGLAFGRPTILVTAAEAGGSGLAGLRLAFAHRIEAAIPGPSGAIAAAMIVGERGAIPAATADDFRNSGLAHLLVIAGLHMSLVAGFAFYATRAGLALVPAVALRQPIKKWAAGVAWLVALVYLVLSGAAVPTERAFVMVSLGLAAILADRWQISMRGLAVAALVILALDPSALIGVSFQMSFAAVLGLLAFYEWAGPALRRFGHRDGALGQLPATLLHLIATTLVVTAATAPFAIYHFNRFPLFSVAANLVGVPLAGFWIMPWAVTACILAPFGLESLALVPMGLGLDLVRWVAHATAGMPLAIIDVPSLPFGGLVAVTIGGVWLCLWRGGWRLAGLAPIAAGLLTLAWTDPPDLLVSGDGRLIAVRQERGYMLSSARTERVTADNWLRVTAYDRADPADQSCRAALCLLPGPIGPVALVGDPKDLRAACDRAVAVIARFRVYRPCPTPIMTIDLASLIAGGSVAVWFDRDGPGGAATRIERANQIRGHRPWVTLNRPDDGKRPVSSAGKARPAGLAP